jgi:hypothetical protein
VSLFDLVSSDRIHPKSKLPRDFLPDAAFALAVNLVILILFVRQMEATRTPSSLAKVSFWTIAMMISADSWQFSAVSFDRHFHPSQPAHISRLPPAARGDWHYVR